MRKLLVLLTLMFCLLWWTTAVSAQSDLLRYHQVRPGDTWAALAWRYDLSAADLAPFRSINEQRQPPVGASFAFVDHGVDRRGELLRVWDGGGLATAVTHHINPWALAIQNDLPHPYYPLLYQPLFLAGGEEPPRDLPIGLESGALEFSQIPAHPGQALGVRTQTTQEVSVTVKLDGREFGGFENGRFHVNLSGTGAFYGAGMPELSIQVGDNPLWSQPWIFVDNEWNFEQLTLTGSAAQIDQESIRLERERLMAIWSQASPAPQWQDDFIIPLANYLFVSSNYGARRSYNGGPYDRYHEGVDFAAYGGTPVLATAAGTVAVAETLFVRGGTVIVDHGLGIYSGYYHMSNILVNVGDQVVAGQIVGEVGTTGLSTGNHLHWDLLVNAIWVDAAAWTEQRMDCWILNGLGQACLSDNEE
ncbi:MAG: LysM peptidoglycan-binding domain-containing M23 family metallopeptidase [Ardenticatenaceae bacterium]|nr:LysM peptidoglycan-binding domain-containing M23 family metallopeptidase [Ardenticatenaceae bacterium]